MDKYIKESDLFKRILNVDFKHDYDGCIKFCQSIPAAYVREVRHGRWIWKGGEGDSRFMCSVCHCKEDVPTCNGEPTIWDYCPNCGSRMDLEGEEE